MATGISTAHLLWTKTDDESRKVYRDAFAPPQPSRTIKAWERAPVPAQAPRMQGQKIWKRTGMNSQREHDKENFDAAQEELKKEGTGARKRLRLRGAKANIGDATWSENLMEKSGTKGGILIDGSTGVVETANTTIAPLNNADSNAIQFIPRKRKNTNHVITPRKPLRQTTLNGQAQTQAFIRSPHPSPEEPRRRKSMRKSIRKSVDGRISDVPAVVHEKSTTEEANTNVAQAENAREDEFLLSQPHSGVEKDAADRILNDKLNVLFDLTDSEQPTVENLEQRVKDDAGRSLDSIVRSSQAIQVPLIDLPEVAKETSQSQARETSENGKLQIADNEKDQLSRGRQPNPSTIMESIETDADAIASQPSKTTSTPKKKRGASQRRGARRSTRTTRASPVRAEDQTASVESVTIPLNVLSDGVAMVVGPHTEDTFTTIAPESSEIVDNAQDPDPIAVSDRGTTVPEVEESIQGHVSYISTNTVGSEADEDSERYTKFEDVGLDDFDVSAQITLQLSAENQQHHIVDMNFELQPVSASTIAISLDSSSDEMKAELVSEIECALHSAGEDSLGDSSPVRFSPCSKSSPQFAPQSAELTVEILENLEPISKPAHSTTVTNQNDTMSPLNDDLPESSTPDPTTSKLTETISENAHGPAYDHDDTDMLRNFLSRVKANKAAKSGIHIPKRKRSLPHSPLQLPLGKTTKISPSPHKMKEEFDVSLPGPSPTKRQKLNNPVLVDEDDTIAESKPTRRSGRTRLPVIKTPLGAPSHIPVRRLGQDGDTTVTLKRSEEKELAALTRVNTRKNRGVSQSVAEVLAKKAEEKEDPALRQRLLKEVFDDKARKVKKERRKTVVWAEELAQYQTMEERKLDGGKEEGKETEKVTGAEEQKSAVKVGIRSKIALGMAVNGTPAPKRKRAR
jgi:hypothetical protein